MMMDGNSDSVVIGKRAREVLAVLSDGHRHQGTDLARHLGISRTAIWKHVEVLRAIGLQIEAGSNGYQLPRSIEWLDAETIRAGLTRPEWAPSIEFLVDSTNACILTDGEFPQVVLAEGQRAGRGRRGRGWVSPPGSGIYLSVGWRFDSSLATLAPLGLVAGIAAARALQGQGLNNIGLKWPNDLVCGEHKLGGCLIDINGTTDGPCIAIFGIGINVDLGMTDDIDQPWTDLHRLGASIGRNRLASALINSLIASIETFETHGFKALMPEWQALDALAGQDIKVLHPSSPTRTGKADGIDEMGRLRLITDQGGCLISSGEVSVRAC